MCSTVPIALPAITSWAATYCADRRIGNDTTSGLALVVSACSKPPSWSQHIETGSSKHSGSTRPSTAHRVGGMTGAPRPDHHPVEAAGAQHRPDVRERRRPGQRLRERRPRGRDLWVDDRQDRYPGSEPVDLPEHMPEAPTISYDPEPDRRSLPTQAANAGGRIVARGSACRGTGRDGGTLGRRRPERGQDRERFRPASSLAKGSVVRTRSAGTHARWATATPYSRALARPDTSWASLPIVSEHPAAIAAAT